jgi:hypothetical protein
MSSWYDNEFGTMGLDCNEDVKYYSSPTPAKRKRDNSQEVMTAMKDFESPVDSVSQNAHSDLYTGRSQVNEHDGYVPPFDLWSTNAFAEAYDYPYGDWCLNNYSIDDQLDAASIPLPPSPMGPTNAAHGLHQMTADTVQADAGVPDVETLIKSEDQEADQVSLTPLGGGEYDDSDYNERRPSKCPKLNKDGIPRKPRQPRSKLLKWDDNDWKNVALGLVWACGENGIQIPFDQASQIVSESCTAGALQQALLKLRGKQIAEGFQIPSLRMAWTRKNKNSTSSKTNADLKPLQNSTGTQKLTTPKRKPTRFEGNQSLLITLKRAYKDTDRSHLASPYGPANAAMGNSQAALQPSTPSSTSRRSNTLRIQSVDQLVNGNAADNVPSAYPGNFAIGTPPTTPGGRIRWDPVFAHPNLTQHGEYAPQYTLAGRAPGIGAVTSPTYNTDGSVFLPASPTTPKDIKRHRRRMTVVEPDFNFLYDRLPPKYRAAETTSNTNQGHAQPNRGSQTGQGTQTPHMTDRADVFGDFAVTKEDLDRNFAMQYEEDINEDEACGGSGFPPDRDPFGGSGGAGGSNGLAA